MIVRFPRLAKAAALLLLSFPQLAAAQGFTGADVLAWPEPQQNALFQTSITMTGIVATRRDDTSHIARCIDDWYAEDVLSQRQSEIRDAMTQHPEYHPQAIIVALIEKNCGSFSGS